MTRRLRWMLLVPLLLAINGVTPATASVRPVSTAAVASPCGTLRKAPTYRHVILIIDENHSYGTIVGSSSAPYLNQLIRECGLATNYHNVTHPSLPNYLALTSGGSLASLHGYLWTATDELPGSVHANNLFHQRRGGWPTRSRCPVPAMSPRQGRTRPGTTPRCTSATCGGAARSATSRSAPPRSPLLRALSSERTAPALALVTPNLCDDTHDCGEQTGDAWLRRWLPLITASAVYRHRDTVVFIVWDEGEPGTRRQPR